MKKINAAIIGCGTISALYIDSIQQQFSVLNVVACNDIIPERMQEFGKKYGVTPMSLDEIMADASIELILNLTIPAVHYTVTKNAMQHGKHVWSEKMIAVTLEEGRELLDLADQCGMRLGVAPDTFMGAQGQTARNAIDSGLIGKPLSFAVSLSRDFGVFGEFLPHLYKKGAGILFDMSGYYLTMLGFLFGPVTRVLATTRTNNPTRVNKRINSRDFMKPYQLEVPNVVTAILEYESGIIGTLHLNSDCILNQTVFFDIFGTDGILSIEDPDTFGGNVWLQKTGGEKKLLDKTHGYARQSRGLGAAEMAWSISAGRPHRASKELAFNVFETAHAIETAAREERIVQVHSRFKRPEPLPAGYIAVPKYGAFAPTEESALV